MSTNQIISKVWSFCDTLRDDGVNVHREFTNAFPAKMIIEKDGVTTENWNRPHGSGLINPALFSPFPKNPVVAKFFKEIGWVEELGSGVRNAFKYVSAYSDGKNPVFEEGDVFKCIIPVDGDAFRSDGVTEGANDGVKIIVDTVNDTVNKTIGESVKRRLVKIILAIINSPGIKVKDILKNVETSERTLKSDLKILINSQLIVYRGSAKTGGYYLSEWVGAKLKSIAL